MKHKEKILQYFFLIEKAGFTGRGLKHYHITLGHFVDYVMRDWDLNPEEHNMAENLQRSIKTWKKRTVARFLSTKLTKSSMSSQQASIYQNSKPSRRSMRWSLAQNRCHLGKNTKKWTKKCWKIHRTYDLWLWPLICGKLPFSLHVHPPFSVCLSIIIFKYIIMQLCIMIWPYLRLNYVLLLGYVNLNLWKFCPEKFPVP